MADLLHSIDIKIDSSGAKVGADQVVAHADRVKRKAREIARLPVGLDSTGVVKGASAVTNEITKVKSRSREIAKIVTRLQQADFQRDAGAVAKELARIKTLAGGVTRLTTRLDPSGVIRGAHQAETAIERLTFRAKAVRQLSTSLTGPLAAPMLTGAAAGATGAALAALPSRRQLIGGALTTTMLRTILDTGPALQSGRQFEGWLQGFRTRANSSKLRLLLDSQGFQGGLNAAKAAVLGFGTVTRTMAAGAIASFGRIKEQIFSLRAAIASASIGLVLRGIFQTGVKFEGFTGALSAITGSMAGAKREMAFVRAEADRLGLNLEQTTDSWVSFSAAAKNTALEGAKGRDVFTQFAEAGAVLNLSNEKMAHIFKALQDMMSKNTISAEELKQQLGDSLPGAMNIAADAMGKTTSQLLKMMANGEVLAGDLLPKMGQQLTKVFPLLPEHLRRAQAELNRFTNSLTELKLKVAESGFLRGMADAFVGLATAMKDPIFTDGATAMGSALGTTLAGGMILAAKATALFKDHIALLTTALVALIGTKLLTGLAAIFGLVGGPITLAALAIAAVTGALIAYRDETVTVGGYQRKLGDVMTATWNEAKSSIGSFVSTAIAKLSELLRFFGIIQSELGKTLNSQQSFMTGLISQLPGGETINKFLDDAAATKQAGIDKGHARITEMESQGMPGPLAKLMRWNLGPSSDQLTKDEPNFAERVKRRMIADAPPPSQEWETSTLPPPAPGAPTPRPTPPPEASKGQVKIADAMKDLEQQARAAEAIQAKIMAMGTVPTEALTRQERITTALEAFKKTVTDNEGTLSPELLHKAEQFITRQVDADAATDKFKKQIEHRAKIQERLNDLTADSTDLQELYTAAQTSTATSSAELGRQMEVLTRFQETRRSLTDKELQATPDELNQIKQKIDAQSRLREAYDKTLRSRDAKEDLSRTLSLEGERLTTLISQLSLSRREREIEADVLEKIIALKAQKIDLDGAEIALVREAVGANKRLQESYETLNHPLRDLGEHTQTTIKDLKDKTLDALGGIEDALVELANGGVKNWKDSIKNMAKAINEDLLRLTIRKNVTAPLAKWLDTGINEQSKEDGWLAKLGITTPAAKPTDTASLTGFTDALTLTTASLNPLNLGLERQNISLNNANTTLPPFIRAIDEATLRLQQLGQPSGSPSAPPGKLPSLDDVTGSPSSSGPSLSTGPSGSDFASMSLSPDLIPTFANGGVVTKPTLAWVGERGPELILPIRPFATGGLTGSLGSIGGSALSFALPMALNALMGLMDSPEKRQAAFDAQNADYQRAFEQTEGPFGQIIIGGVNASKSLDWASKVPGALGYRKPPTLEEAGMLESILQPIIGMMGSIGGGIAGAKFASLFGGAKTPTPSAGTSTSAGLSTGASGSDFAPMSSDLIPMAKGGIVSRPTLAWIGERGPETVIPMQTGGVIPGWLPQLLSLISPTPHDPMPINSQPWHDWQDHSLQTDPFERRPIGRNGSGGLAGLWEQISELFNPPSYAAGGHVSRATLALIGEAGPEAIVPLKQGKIPAKADAAGHLHAYLPSGLQIPIALAEYAMGGIIPSAAGLSLRAYDQGGIASSPQMALFGEGSTAAPFDQGPDARPIPVAMPNHQDPSEDQRPTIINFHIATPDANSFRASQPQIEGRMVSALTRAKKRNA